MPRSRSRSDFADFEIELRSVEDGFEARVLTAPYGRLSAPFVPPFAGADLQALLEALERQLRARAAPAAHREILSEAHGQAPNGEPSQAGANGHTFPRDPKALGRTLFDALLPLPLAAGFHEALASQAPPARGLRLRLTFDRREDFAGLATMPWELLFDGQQFLALQRGTPIVRSHNQRIRPPTVASRELRVLLVDSRPHDLTSLATARETGRIRSALAANPAIEAIHVPRPDIRKLRQQLDDQQCHVLHFMGHGDFRDGQEKEMVLWFEGDRGQAEAVSGELLAELVSDLPDLRLVVLNSCWGGALPRRQGQDPLSGVAAALLVRGIPAVVAMQFPITDGAAIAFADGFYGRLARTGSVCEAVTEGRLAIMTNDQGSLEWATPALFLAGGDRLFAIRAAARRPTPTPGDAGASAEGSTRQPAAPMPLRLAVQSFAGFSSTGGADTVPDAVLDLTNFFDGRRIRRHEDWREEVFPRLRDFLLRHAAARRPLVLDFAAHATLAFAAGYCLEAKSGLDITLMQRGQRGTAVWRAEAGPSRQGPLWIAEPDRPRDAAAADVALAASVTWAIVPDVEHYLETARVPVRRLVPMMLHPRPAPTGVADGHHALELAQELALTIRGRTVQERAAVLHFFSAAPNALLFYLGQLGRSLGTVQLYEHDFESGQPGAYLPSLRLPLPRSPEAGA
jgi:CHAT domain/SMODS-associated and fused to various effectors sensor domain